MKKIKKMLLACLLIFTVLCAAALPGHADESPYLPGMDRVKRDAPKVDLQSVAGLAAEREVELTDGFPLYTPSDPQPLNAILVTDPDCQFSWKNAMRRVAKQGMCLNPGRL